MHITICDPNCDPPELFIKSVQLENYTEIRIITKTGTASMTLGQFQEIRNMKLPTELL